MSCFIILIVLFLAKFYICLLPKYDPIIIAKGNLGKDWTNGKVGEPRTIKTK